MSGQKGNTYSSNNAIVAWKMTLLGFRINLKPLVPSVYLINIISSAPGASLFTRTSDGMYVYAPHPNTHKCETSGLLPFNTSKGVRHARHLIGVLL